VNLFISSKLEWQECCLSLKQTTKFPEDERVTFNVQSTPSKPISLKIRIPYWATEGVSVAINGEVQNVTATPSSYLSLQHPLKARDVVTIDLPLTLHMVTVPDDKEVQAAMYGPLVLAARLGTEGMTTSMIYGGSGPRGYDDGYPMPTVDTKPRHHRGETTPPQPKPEDATWLERIESTPQYALQFRTKSRIT
jgi:hypothetical protein